MNREIIKKYISERKYDECITILRKELIDDLTDKIKQNNQYFSYTTTQDLYEASKQYLTEKDVKCAYKLYQLDLIDEVDEYVLEEILLLFKTSY